MEESIVDRRLLLMAIGEKIIGHVSDLQRDRLFTKSRLEDEDEH